MKLYVFVVEWSPQNPPGLGDSAFNVRVTVVCESIDDVQRFAQTQTEVRGISLLTRELVRIERLGTVDVVLDCESS